MAHGMRRPDRDTPSVPATQPDRDTEEAAAGAQAAAVRGPPLVAILVFFGLLLAAFLLAIWLLDATVRQALRVAGIGDPALLFYTLVLGSPILFEALYPAWRSRLVEATRAAGRSGPRAAEAGPGAGTPGRVGPTLGIQVLDGFHASAPYLILLGLVFLVARTQNAFDPWLAARFGWDATGVIHSVEGGAVAATQAALRSRVMDDLMIVCYTTVYVTYHFVAVFGFALAARVDMVRRVVAAWTLVWVGAIPFYVLLPVFEAWASGPSLPADAVLPTGVLAAREGLQAATHAVSSVNNSFPSLHNAFAWALPWLLWRSGMRRAAMVAVPAATLITLSTLYLGIHWYLDVAGGVLLAIAAVEVAVRLRWEVGHDLKVRRFLWHRNPVPGPNP